MIPFRQIFQEMAAEKLRLGLMILAIAWATICIALMLSIGEGLSQGLTRHAESGNGKLIRVMGGMATMNYGQFSQGKMLKLYPEDIDLIRALPAVKAAEPVVTWDKEVIYNKQVSWQAPMAVSADYQSMMGFSIADGGRWLNPLDLKEQRKVIVLGESVAVELFYKGEITDWDNLPQLDESPVGKTVKIGEESFTIVGILKPSAMRVGEGVPANYAVFIPFTTWQRFNTNAPVSALEVYPAEGSDRTLLAKTIRQVISRKYGASLQDAQIVQLEDMLERQKTMKTFLLGLQSFLGIIGLVTLLVAGVGIANVMYASVKRATRDIGVRMAIGATPTDITLHYLVQAFLTMGLGGVIGLAISQSAVQALSAIPIEGNYLYEELGRPVPELSLAVVMIVVGALALVGLLAAWFPARQAASVTPLEALQGE
ncbi:peptide ABC transporter permease [Photobacterium swingsii]|uniref:ABC transporter permease n=1 Tax=Photobacterium swingsii TaxID=680026 RepID=A0A0J8VEL7_9GAMM|nr:ABC transporter permease [Photobacterium swingsii]KMV31542.1 peptide ABC transporter permease [Photobacterium swingsii]PSW24935.1 ABC transporter permease [Photobacterium swingsii]